MTLKAAGIEQPAGTGYAGHNEGLNNPANEHVAGDPQRPDDTNAGPLPQGEYTIGKQQDNVSRSDKDKTFKASMRLTPDPHNDMTGRSHDDSFLIHGSNDYTRQNSSQGCIVMKEEYRNNIGQSGVIDLEVVP